MDRVLVVDDSPVVSAMLSAWLGMAGYAVSLAGSAAEADEAVARDHPSLVLLDLVLPDESGVAVCRRLKADESTARIPVVVLTGDGTSANRICCLELGAEDFLTKPVGHDELVARVRSLLRAKRLSDRLLISFLEMDKLGAFAEAFTTQSITDWSAVEVANSMARHVLGRDPEMDNHPRIAWAGQRSGQRLLGATWYYDGGAWMQENAMLRADRLAEALLPFARGDASYVCKGEVPAGLCALLNLPSSPRPQNFVAYWPGDNAILVASYPWEVGAYELPLLRAVLRQWAVFERIRHEASMAEQAFFATMEALALAAEYRDRETAHHLRRVSTFARMLATTLGCEPHFVKWVWRSAPMHDVGKLAVPVEVVNKPGPLSPGEWEVMQRHTTQGERLLGELPPLAMAREIARHHHESWDGSGYPDCRRGDEIPRSARLVKVVDVYDALRTPRPYKGPLSHGRAIDILRRGDERIDPGHFEPAVLAAFLDIEAEIARAFADLTSDNPLPAVGVATSPTSSSSD